MLYTTTLLNKWLQILSQPVFIYISITGLGTAGQSLCLVFSFRTNEERAKCQQAACGIGLAALKASGILLSSRGSCLECPCSDSVPLGSVGPETPYQSTDRSLKAHKVRQIARLIEFLENFLSLNKWAKPWGVYKLPNLEATTYLPQNFHSLFFYNWYGGLEWRKEKAEKGDIGVNPLVWNLEQLRSYEA